MNRFGVPIPSTQHSGLFLGANSGIPTVYSSSTGTMNTRLFQGQGAPAARRFISLSRISDSDSESRGLSVEIAEYEFSV